MTKRNDCHYLLVHCPPRMLFIAQPRFEAVYLVDCTYALCVLQLFYMCIPLCFTQFHGRQIQNFTFQPRTTEWDDGVDNDSTCT